MADSRFFAAAGPFTLNELATIAGAEVGGEGDPARPYKDVAPLDAAGADEVSFLDNKRYVEAFRNSGAGACIVHPNHAGDAPAGMSLLLTEKPYHAYARVAAAFHPGRRMESGVHPAATVAPTATLGDNVYVGPGACIGERAEIGPGTRIGPNTVVGPGVTIGEDCDIGANVVLACCLIGDRVILHPGVRIGQDGFGFALDPAGHSKVPQLGRVIVEQDVEIGANSTVDRGTGPDTVIGAGTKIDNLVQIAHNVRLGRSCVVVSQVGISGSTHVGDFVMIGGQAGLTGHLTIGDGAQIAAQSGVMRDIEPGGKVGGSPAQPMSAWLRGVAALDRLARKKKD